MKKYNNLLYWITIGSMLLWFAYTKGWIFANFESIDAKKAISLLKTDTNITLLDVRTPTEYQSGHLQNAQLIPLQVLSQNMHRLSKDRDKKILVYCKSGNRSVAASRILKASGFTPINIKGGIMELEKTGITLIK